MTSVEDVDAAADVVVDVTGAGAPSGRPERFQVRLDAFEGPFDLLLGLIAKHRLDVTEIALAQVTDEFVAHVKARGGDWDLEETSEFLLIAATLLDLKAARLLPSAQVDDEEDLALLEARDLLFARLLQYRAFKQVATAFGTRLAEQSRRAPRSVPVEPEVAALLPELVLGLTPEQLAEIAVRAMAPRPKPTVTLDHLHAPPVSVREQAAVLVQRLRQVRTATFRCLVGDADATVVVVARFLAVLELFREGAVAFEQATPLGELTVLWTGADEGEVSVQDSFEAEDEPPGTRTAPDGGQPPDVVDLRDVEAGEQEEEPS